MNKRQMEYIALYLFVFGAILLFGVMARKYVLVKGYDEFSSAVAFFATVIVLSALYISLQMTLNELLLPRMEKFLMRFPAFQKLEEKALENLRYSLYYLDSSILNNLLATKTILYHHYQVLDISTHFLHNY